MVSQRAQLLLADIEKVCGQMPLAIVALEGRCSSGKTTLAAEVEAAIQSGNYPRLPRESVVIHMDDFFLRPEQRTEERLAAPGGNIDYERFLTEVLEPLSQGRAFSYRPYDCHTQSWKAEIHVPQVKLAIVEGAYSCHAALWPFYAKRYFLKVTNQEQYQRLLRREGRDGYDFFAQNWIPLEERYFAYLLAYHGHDFIYL